MNSTGVGEDEAACNSALALVRIFCMVTMVWTRCPVLLMIQNNASISTEKKLLRRSSPFRTLGDKSRIRRWRNGGKMAHLDDHQTRTSSSESRPRGENLSWSRNATSPLLPSLIGRATNHPSQSQSVSPKTIEPTPRAGACSVGLVWSVLNFQRICHKADAGIHKR